MPAPISLEKLAKRTTTSIDTNSAIHTTIMPDTDLKAPAITKTITTSSITITTTITGSTENIPYENLGAQTNARVVDIMLESVMFLTDGERETKECKAAQVAHVAEENSKEVKHEGDWSVYVECGGCGICQSCRESSGEGVFDEDALTDDDDDDDDDNDDDDDDGDDDDEDGDDDDDDDDDDSDDDDYDEGDDGDGDDSDDDDDGYDESDWEDR